MFLNEPPKLSSLSLIMEKIPKELLPWIAEKHVQYLDNRIHKIDSLTEYLANCDWVAKEREEFISFVEWWTRLENANLHTYFMDYTSRFHSVRSQVDTQCDRILNDNSLWISKSELLGFWHDFAYINEIDSLHGMFLTSGRWHVNVMLPVIKELIYCTLPEDLHSDRNDIAYSIARRIITPRFASTPDDYDYDLEKRFITLFIPVLQYYDRQILFLFDVMANFTVSDSFSLIDFVQDVNTFPEKYTNLVDSGIYPPFGLHELRSSRRPRRKILNYEEVVYMLLNNAADKYKSRTKFALDLLAQFKKYEVNYNNYNYKGRFGLISKYFYWKTSLLCGEQKDEFLEAILGDRFFEALPIIVDVFEKGN